MAEGEGNERADALLFEEKEEEGKRERESGLLAANPLPGFVVLLSSSLSLPPPLAFCVTFDPERKTADCRRRRLCPRPTDGTAANANGVKRL